MIALGLIFTQTGSGCPPKKDSLDHGSATILMHIPPIYLMKYFLWLPLIGYRCHLSRLSRGEHPFLSLLSRINCRRYCNSSDLRSFCVLSANLVNEPLTWRPRMLTACVSSPLIILGYQSRTATSHSHLML